MSKALVYCAGGGIGDSLVASVVARALRKRYAHVDALTLPHHKDALDRVPDIDTVLIDDGQPDDIANLLAERHYDAVVVTWATARTARIVVRAQIPVRVGQARRLYSSAFTHQVVVRSERGDVTTPWVQILLDYARAIHCDVDCDFPTFTPTADDHAIATQWLMQRQLTSFIILHATNAIATTRGIWPTQAWSALARALRDRFSVPILLSGGEPDAKFLERIAQESGALPVLVPLGAFGAIAQRSIGFCGISTGSMHIAAAVGAPTLGLFPFQSDVPDRWGPRGKFCAVVRSSYPCHGGDTKEQCPDYACIAHLDVTRILATFRTLVDCARVAPHVYFHK